jgi:hypothetical protein
MFRNMVHLPKKKGPQQQTAYHSETKKREFVKFGKKTSKSREFASARGSTGEGPLT